MAAAMPSPKKSLIRWIRGIAEHGLAHTFHKAVELNKAGTLDQYNIMFFKRAAHAAEHLLSAIAKKHLDLAPEMDGIVLDSTADYHKDIHTRMIYADYYFVEGLLRLQGKEFFAW